MKILRPHANCPVMLCKGMPDDWDDEENYIAPKK